MVQTLEANYLPEGAKLFEGRYINVMPILLKDGLVPISPAEVMDLKNQHPTSDENGPWSTWLDTGMGCAADRKNVYLFPYSKVLRRITPETKLTDWGVALKDTEGAKTFNRSDLILDKDLTEKEALAHPIWLALADKDKERLGKYVQTAFKLGKDTFNYDKNMGFYTPDEKRPILRAVYLLRLGGRSRVIGYRYLGGGARLVGVQSKSAKPTAQKSVPLEEIIKISEDYVPRNCQSEFKQKLKELYSR